MKTKIKQTPILIADQEAQAALARGLLEKGKFKEARELFKQLCKADRKKYLPELVVCYKKQAQLLAERGQQSEVKVLLEYIKNLSLELGEPADDSALLIAEWKTAVKQGDFKKAATVLVGDLLKMKTPLSDPRRQQAADCAVVSFETLPAADAGAARFFEEAGAVQQALERLCQEQLDQAAELIRPIGAESPFSQWKLFIKGLIAFYRGDTVKAQKAFMLLEPESAPGRSARAFRDLMTYDAEMLDQSDHKAATAAGICFAAGLYDQTEPLARMDYLWRVKRFRDSYLLAAQNLEGFPCAGPSLPGLLSRFYFNAPFMLSEREGEPYLSFLAQRKALSRQHYNREGEWISRMFALFIGENFNGLFLDAGEMMIETWEHYLRSRRARKGVEPDLEAIVYAFAGTKLAEPVPDDLPRPEAYYFDLSAYVREIRRNAEGMLLKSIEADPAASGAAQTLLRCYEIWKEDRKKAGLLEKLVKNRPEDKDTLVAAGLECLKRKANRKAGVYLERAFALDPLDGFVREQLLVCLLQRAVDNEKQWRPLLERCLSLAQSGSAHLHLGKAFMYARYALLGLREGDVSLFQAQFEAACRDGAALIKVYYFTDFTAEAYGLERLLPPAFHRAFAGIKETARDMQAASHVAEVLFYFWQSGGTEAIQARQKEVRALLENAAGAGFSRKDAALITTACMALGWKKTAQHYIAAALRHDRQDPLFELFKLKIEQSGRARKGARPEVRKKLERYLAEARRRHDDQAVALITRALKTQRRKSSLRSFIPDVSVDGQDEAREEDGPEAGLPGQAPDPRDEKKKSGRARPAGAAKKEAAVNTQMSLFD